MAAITKVSTLVSQSSVYAMDSDPKGENLIIGGLDGTMTLYLIVDPALEHFLRTNTLTLCQGGPEVQVLACSRQLFGKDYIIAAANNNKLYMTTFKNVMTGLAPQTGRITDITWAQEKCYSSSIDGTVAEFTVCATGFTNVVSFLRLIQTHDGMVTGIAWSDHGFVTQGSDGCVNVWDDSFQQKYALRVEGKTDQQFQTEIAKSSASKNLASIAGFNSLVDGYPCGLIVDTSNFNLRELPLPDLKQNQANSWAGIGTETKVVCCSAFTSNLLILGTNVGFLAYRVPKLAYVWSAPLPNKTDITNLVVLSDKHILASALNGHIYIITIM